MVSIQGNSTSMDIGNAEFFRLRKKIAGLAGEDIKNHYAKLEKGMQFPIGERNAFFIEHDKQTEALGKKYNGKKDTILDFFYLFFRQKTPSDVKSGGDECLFFLMMYIFPFWLFDALFLYIFFQCFYICSSGSR